MILTVPQSRGGRAHEDVFGSGGGDYIGLDFLLGHPVVVVLQHGHTRAASCSIIVSK